MDEQRKGAFWPWLIVAMIGILLLYPLSMGPAEWLTATTNHSVQLTAVTNFVYAPVWYVVEICPECVADAYLDYVDWWRELERSRVEDTRLRISS